MCKDNESLDSSDDNDNINYGAKKSFKKRNENKKSTKMNNNCNSTITKVDNFNKKDIANDKRKSFNFKHRVKQERSDCKVRHTENKNEEIRSNMAATNQQIKPRKAYFKMFNIFDFLRIHEEA